MKNKITLTTNHDGPTSILLEHDASNWTLVREVIAKLVEHTISFTKFPVEIKITVSNEGP